MNITEGLKIISDGWLRKPKGFRVKFQKQTENGVAEQYSPPVGAAPMTSEVTAWRYAWKLGQATQSEAEKGVHGALYNITVVDDEDKPIRFYGTGDFEVYNTRPS